MKEISTIDKLRIQIDFNNILINVFIPYFDSISFLIILSTKETQTELLFFSIQSHRQNSTNLHKNRNLHPFFINFGYITIGKMDVPKKTIK